VVVLVVVVLENLPFEFASAKAWRTMNRGNLCGHPVLAVATFLNLPSTTTTTTQTANPTNETITTLSSIPTKRSLDNHSQWVTLPVSGLERVMRSAVIIARRYETMSPG
jgi:hypothetical protein